MLSCHPDGMSRLAGVKCILYSAENRPRYWCRYGDRRDLAEFQCDLPAVRLRTAGADGKSRPLHTEKAPAVLNPSPVEQDWSFGEHLGQYRCFTVDLLRNDAEGCCDGSSFSAQLVTAGEGELRCGDEKIKICAGECVFLPADTGDWQLCGNATVLQCYLSGNIA